MQRQALLNTLREMSSCAVLLFIFTTATVLSCVDSFVWSNWNTWSACGVYDYARQTKYRKCLDKEGKDLNETQCTGISKRTRQCEKCSHSLLNGNFLDFKITSSRKKTLVQQMFCLTKDEHVQISFKNFVRLTGLFLKQNGGFDGKYELKYSYDEKKWFDYISKDNEIYMNAVKKSFLSPIVTRSIRVYTTARACFNIDLYGCGYNCGGLFKNDAVKIQSPKASASEEELQCLWRIESELAIKQQFKFPYFKIHCKNSMLEFYDGALPFTPKNDVNLVEAFCGHSGEVSSQTYDGGAIWMYYYSNSTDNTVGFQLEVNSIAVEKKNKTSGSVVFPPSGYSNVFRYSWIITAPRDNDTIIMTLKYFQSNNSLMITGNCYGDHVIIRNGDGDDAIVGEFCNVKTKNKVYTSTKGLMKIKFKSKSRNPKWRIAFSYQVKGYPLNKINVNTATPTQKGTMDFSQKHEMSGKPTPLKNETILQESLRKQVADTSNHLPIIVSSVVVVIAILCIIALVYYFRRRKECQRKHPYDCSNRPISHFGAHDATPFINSNLLMWNDSKNIDKYKKYRPVVEVKLSESEPQRWSIISQDMLKSESKVSIQSCGNEKCATLVVSDNFTEECMTLLNNNLISTIKDFNEEIETEIDYPSNNSNASLPEADRQTLPIAKEDNGKIGTESVEKESEGAVENQ